MNARIEDATSPGRFRQAVGPAGRVLVQGLLLLAGLAVTVLGFGRFVDANEEAVAYHSAAVCDTAAATPGTDCVRHETGKVTDKNSGDSYYNLTVARETAPKHTFEVPWTLYTDTEVGSEVDLAVFHGRVAEISHHGSHSQTAGTSWSASLEVALLVGLGSTLTVQGLTWSRSGSRGARIVLTNLTVTLTAFFGCLVLMSSTTSLGLTLAIPVFGWLLMTAVVTTASWDQPLGDPLYGRRPRPAW
ncbi:hypothetical protein [Kitasatospora sp. NPDC047058]|uniref:hypothetical protein n=1 Tax=Kitasatospora sp. NPDC047058 TaxID=3155620 RepID=UPI0033DE89DC